MARKLVLENLMKLAQGIGANPQKFMGTKTNITFLGTGPTRHSLFQKYLPLRPETPVESLGRPESLVNAVENAMGYATAGKLNDIQLKILTENLTGINKILNPPPLPMASITTLSRSGLKPRREWANPEQGSGIKSVLPEPGPEDIAAFRGALDQQTGMSRAIARQLLHKDTRLNLPDDVLNNLRTGSRGEDPLDLMAKYYGRSMEKYDDFLNSVNLDAARPEEFAEMILKNVRLIPQFAEGGLAKILEVNDQVNRYDLM